MGIKIWQVDAFTSEPFKGNPAAVCLLEGAADEGWMQQVAREMNLSETAFLYPVEGGYHLRWFTPGGEVSLCGHATLATAHTLWREGFLPGHTPARFRTLAPSFTQKGLRGSALTFFSIFQGGLALGARKEGLVLGARG